jgi:hypothetical protein
VTSRPTIAAAVAVAAGAISLSMGAGAETTTYIITDGKQAKVEHSCTRIVNAFTNQDCTFGRTQTSANSVPDQFFGWSGPTRQGGYFEIGSVADTPIGTPPPALSVFNPNDANPATVDVFEPDDIKVEPVVVGTVDIDDNGTPADGSDDTVLLTFSIQGPTPTAGIVRNFTTGQSTVALQRWRSLDQTMAAPYPVDQAVPNMSGGFDYIIGSRGTPTRLCRALNPGVDDTFDPDDCFPTNNYDKTTLPTPPAWWAPVPAVSSVGIERSAAIANRPGASPNVGIATVGEFAGRVIGVNNEDYSCDNNNQASDDCVNSALVWGALEDPGFDNMVGVISTGTDGITSAQLYWTQEYNIGAFGGGTNINSFQASEITFTGIPQGTEPNALDDVATVVAGTTTNTINVLGNDLNFGPVPPTTVAIDQAPAQGVATVNANGSINFDATGVPPGVVTFTYEACDGLCDTATVTVTVQADLPPVGGAVNLALNTQGRSGAAAAGTFTFPGASLGNQPATVTLTSTGTAGKGACTVSGTAITYTPVAAFVAGGQTDSCGYSITDLDGDNATGTLNVTITDAVPVLNDGAPREVDAGDTATSDATFTAGNGVVADHTLAVTTPATSGSCAVSVVGNNVRVTYTANDDAGGDDSCVVTLTDADGDSDTGLFTFNVISTGVTLPGGGSAIDPWSLLLLGGLPVLARRRRG